MKFKYDFSGYATKFDAKCSDGVTIKQGAFDAQNGNKVPLVWAHNHDNAESVIGHAMLETRDEGVYVYCSFNNTENADLAKELVQHEDVDALSIYANKLTKVGNFVKHGIIREVSLVLAGANPEAKIDFINIKHAEGDDNYEAVIKSGEKFIADSGEIDSDNFINHSGIEGNKKVDVSVDKNTLEYLLSIQHDATKKNRTVNDVFEEFTDEQKQLVIALIEDAITHSGVEEGGENMNIFDRNKGKTAIGQSLSHADTNEMLSILVADGIDLGSFRKSVIKHADDYGVKDVNLLFPDAVLVGGIQEDRDDNSWVNGFMKKTKHVPFNKIKTMYFDLTEDELRAKGYITATQKTDIVVPLLQRETMSQMVYVRSKLDREDVIDADYNLVQFCWRILRMLLFEELARAAMIGDGRAAANKDKIKTDRVRPIYGENDIFAKHIQLDTYDESTIIDRIIRSRKYYKGSNPTMYVTEDTLTDMLLLKDTTGRDLYNMATLKQKLRVSNIETIDAFEMTRRTVGEKTYKPLVIYVNPADYTFGASKGGEVTKFDDFDIDFNQYKYLIESKQCGALTKIRSAVVIEVETTALAG